MHYSILINLMSPFQVLSASGQFVAVQKKIYGLIIARQKKWHLDDSKKKSFGITTAVYAMMNGIVRTCS